MTVAVTRTKAEQAYSETFEAVAAKLPGNRAVAEARKAAIGAFAGLGLPHRRHRGVEVYRPALRVEGGPAAGHRRARGDNGVNSSGLPGVFPAARRCRRWTNRRPNSAAVIFRWLPSNIDTRDLDKPKSWLKEAGITSLGYFSDEKAKIFQDLKLIGKAFGMPTSMLIDASGCEIGTIAGPAEWASDDALKLVRAALGR